MKMLEVSQLNGLSPLLDVHTQFVITRPGTHPLYWSINRAFIIFVFVVLTKLSILDFSTNHILFSYQLKIGLWWICFSFWNFKMLYLLNEINCLFFPTNCRYDCFSLYNVVYATLQINIMPYNDIHQVDISVKSIFRLQFS